MYGGGVLAETQKYGILEVDGELRVTCMKEKPAASETTSRRAVSSLVGPGGGAAYHKSDKLDIKS